MATAWRRPVGAILTNKFRIPPARPEGSRERTSKLFQGDAPSPSTSGQGRVSVGRMSLVT